jgi:hypothetical protein
MSSYVTASGAQVGLLNSGFVAERQTDIILDLQAAWQQTFGANVNLDPRSNNGQIIGIMSERFALLWELLEAVYNSQYPQGAEGTSVDNILSLTGLVRQAATFGRTNPNPLVQGNQITLYGLVLYGTAGTTVPKGSRIGDSQTPQNVFATDSDILIAPAANAVQTVVLSGQPTQGSFALSIVDPAGNTLTTPSIAYSTSAATVQAAMTGLYDSISKQSPYTDVLVTQNGQNFTLTFGGGTPAIGQPTSGNQPQPLMTLASSTLQTSNSVINVSISDTIQGQPAQGLGTATEVATGPQSVLAGTLTQILTPVNGWNAVTNPLDCLTGTNTETDTQALLRRSQLLAVQAQGPTLSVLQNVQQLDGVTTALAFQNTTNAAQQLLTFASAPSSGTYQLVVGGGTTSPISYNAAASTVQNAIAAISGLTPVIVTGTYVYGYTIDFNGSMGGQAIALAQVINNTTGVPASVQFGRPPKSLEVVVAGGSNQAIAKAIYGQSLAGLSTYASPVAQTTGNVTAGSAIVTVLSVTGIVVGLSVFGFGLPAGATVTAISGNNLTLSQAAISTYANTPLLLNYAQLISDSNGNPVQVGFSRPLEVPIYCKLILLTDMYTQPGNPASGINPSSQFNVASVPQIQADLVAIANAIPVGGRIVGFGSNGLIGSFNNVPGVVSAQLYFGPSNNPAQIFRFRFHECFKRRVDLPCFIRARCISDSPRSI